VKPIRALLADDHALVRAGIRALIQEIEGVEVIGEAGDGEETLRLIRELRPDLVLLDITMPERSGFEVLEHSVSEFPEVRIIVLTVHEAGDYAIRALRAGAAGYLPKSAASAELQLAIETAMRGETYVSPEISQRTLVEHCQGTEHRHLPGELTPRQREILIRVAEGHTTKDIAHSLNISVKTVESHRTLLMERLDIHDVAGLVRYSIRIGLVKVE